MKNSISCWLLFLFCLLTTSSQGQFGPDRVIIKTDTRIPETIFSSDLDGDGDMDVLTGAGASTEGKVVWYRNEDGQGNFGPQQIIFNSGGAVEDVYAADMDGDGDMDVLSANSWPFRGIIWYENEDGQGNFGNPKIIIESDDNPLKVLATDLDGDGDLDVLYSTVPARVIWQENEDGQGNFGPQQIISIETEEARFVFASDLDGDGDLDVLSASSGNNYVNNKVFW